MAVQIIERGQLPEEREFVQTCKRCKTKFKFLQKDAQIVRAHDQRDSDYLIIDCPLCHDPVSVYI